MAGQIVSKGDRTWMVRVYLGPNPKTGKKQYLNKVVHGAKKDAQAVLNELLVQKDKGQLSSPTNLTLNEYLDRWLEQATRIKVRPRTFDDYVKNLRRYIRPVLGHRQLAKIHPLEIQALYNEMLARGLSPRTVRYAHSILHSALKQAMKWQLLTENPSDRVELPRQKRKEMHAFSQEEARRFMKAANYDRWRAFFILALTTGMRPGEILALRWKDVDLEKGVVTVNRAVSWANGQFHFDEPKTSRSRRSIPLDKTKTDLISHRRRQVQEFLALGRHLNENDLIFSNELGEPLKIRNLVRHHFKPILRAAGLPGDFRLYDLRHSCATILLGMNTHPKVVSERLGHASTNLTLDTYSHVLPVMQQKATQNMESAVL